MKIVLTILISLGTAIIYQIGLSQEKNTADDFHLENPSVSVSFVAYTNSATQRLAILQVTNPSVYLFLIKSNWNETLTSSGWIQTNQNSRESVVLSHSIATITVPVPDEISNWRSALFLRAECGSGMSQERKAFIKQLETKGQKKAAAELYFPTWVFKTSVISNSISK